jgi:hypothetical protein
MGCRTSLIYNTNIENIDFLYHGERVNYFELENINIQLYSESRYFEYINANIILKKTLGISDIISKTIEEICRVEVIQFRKTELNNILIAICFYIKFSMLPFNELVKILNYLNQFKWQQFTFEETLIYLGKLEMINHTMAAGEYLLNAEYIITIPNDAFAFITFQCDTDNFDKALSTSNKIIKFIFNILKLPDTFYLVDQRHGSWELTFLVPVLCAMTLPLVFKNITGIIIDFSFKIKYNNALLARISKDSKTKELKEIAEAAISGCIISPNSENLTLTSKIKEAIDIIKSIKIGIQ